MSLFGRDPKDDVIDTLRDERDYLRGKVAELEKQLLALTSTHAYRLVHGEGDLPPARPGEPDPFTLKATVYEPEKTLAAIEAQFRHQGD